MATQQALPEAEREGMLGATRLICLWHRHCGILLATWEGEACKDAGCDRN